MISTLLLVVFVALSAVVWRSVIKRSRTGQRVLVGSWPVGVHAGVLPADPHGHGEHAGVVRTDHDDAAVRLSQRQDSFVTVKLICHGCRVWLSTLSCHVYRPVGNRNLPPETSAADRSGLPARCGGRPTRSGPGWIGDPRGPQPADRPGEQLQIDHDRRVGVLPRNQHEQGQRRARRPAGSEEAADAPPLMNSLPSATERGRTASGGRSCGSRFGRGGACDPSMSVRWCAICANWSAARISHISPKSEQGCGPFS